MTPVYRSLAHAAGTVLSVSPHTEKFFEKSQCVGYVTAWRNGRNRRNQLCPLQQVQKCRRSLRSLLEMLAPSIFSSLAALAPRKCSLRTMSIYFLCLLYLPYCVPPEWCGDLSKRWFTSV